MIFALMATICFSACDDKDDNKQEANTCEPASCKVDNATETGCDAGQCVAKACKDGFKVSDDKKSCEEVKESPKCDPAGTPACDPKCEDGSDCICRADKWQCVPVDDKDKCDPKCEDGKECKCVEDKCECAVVNPCAEKSAGDECAEGKTCQLDGEALSCKDKPAVPPTECDPKCEDGVTKCECTMEACACVPVTAPADKCDPVCDEEKQDCICEADKCECKDKDAAPADPCADKSENDACDENKTCQKGEGDKLECKDAPAKDPK